MRTRRVTRASGLLACGVALSATAVLTGCGAATSRTSGGTAGAGHPDTTTVAILQCYRTHGDPGFPDPVYDPGDGNWHFAVSPGTAPASTQQACRHLFPSVNASPPVPQAQFQQLVRQAECIRQHGVPGWPDPDPDGAFPLSPSLQTKSHAFAAASAACQRYWPSGGINEYAVS